MVVRGCLRVPSILGFIRLGWCQGRIDNPQARRDQRLSGGKITEVKKMIDPTTAAG